jgi:Protein of unknown function (DUF2380)
MRKWRSIATTMFGLLLALAYARLSAADPKSIAVMDFELIDDMAEYEQAEVKAAQDKRIQMISDELRREFAERKLYRVADNSGAAATIAKLTAGEALRTCNGCELQIGRELGVERIAIGWVQKVSNLILNINLEVKDVQSGDIVYRKSVDLRSNSDVSWMRGIRYLVDSIEEKRQHLK